VALSQCRPTHQKDIIILRCRHVVELATCCLKTPAFFMQQAQSTWAGAWAWQSGCISFVLISCFVHSANVGQTMVESMTACCMRGDCSVLNFCEVTGVPATRVDGAVKQPGAQSEWLAVNISMGRMLPAHGWAPQSQLDPPPPPPPPLPCTTPRPVHREPVQPTGSFWVQGRPWRHIHLQLQAGLHWQAVFRAQNNGSNRPRSCDLIQSGQRICVRRDHAWRQGCLFRSGCRPQFDSTCRLASGNSCCCRLQLGVCHCGQQWRSAVLGGQQRFPPCTRAP
jgi:hypothetical protein